MAYLEDAIFEGVPPDEAVQWPERFMGSIPVGADVSKVHIDFLIAINERNLSRLGDNENQQRSAIEAVIAILQDWQRGNLDDSAASAAWTADSADLAALAADSAVWTAELAARAAVSAVWTADLAARAADSAARAAVSAARAASSAAASAASAEWEWMADTLIGLIAEAPKS